MKQILYFTKQMHAYAGKIVYVNLLGMVFISFLDGMGVFLLLPLLNISGFMNLNPNLSLFSSILEQLKRLPQPAALLVILGAYVALIGGQAVVQRGLTLRDTKIHAGFMNHIRMHTYQALLEADWDFFIKKRKSELIHSLTDELGHVTNGTYMFLQFLASLVFTVIQVVIAFWLSPKLTLFVLICGFAVAFFSRAYIRKSKLLGNRTSTLSRSYIGAITDHFNGIKDIKSNMLEASRQRWLQIWCEQLSEERLQHARVKAGSQLFYKIASSAIVACFLYSSILLFHSQAGQLALILVIFSRLWPRFTGIQSSLEQIAAAVPAFQSLMELQQQCLQAKETQGGIAGHDKAQPIVLEQGLECRNVYFRYNRKEPVFALQDIHLYIRANEMTAIIGRSGAGKSTLVDILMGLLKPERGQVLVDGVPLAADNLLAVRRSIGYVPQDPFLFNGSIRDNLMMVAPNASEEQLWEALEFSASAEFVRKLPGGLETLIGDRGARLSGGERQRLVLARTMLRKPSILVLDEATSSLDTENEAHIQQALERLQGKLTMIVIAHRLSTIQNADQVIVLDQGNLLSARTTYRKEVTV